MTNLIWLKGGACGGNTMSFLSAEQPTVIELVADFGIRILYHPTIAMEIGEQVNEVLNEALSGRIPLDIFVFEGAVVQGSNGKGNMNYFAGRPMKDWVTDLAATAKYVVAIGDCATWGGIIAVPPNPTESTGMQFHKKEKGGFLGKTFISKSGLPIINIPGCPAHPDWITQILVAIAVGRMDEVALDDLQRPKTFFTDFVQTGCTNAPSFFDKIKGGFGKRGGCLFYEVGCRGPMTHAGCNRILWNRTSSKTRANHPCLGCTEPGFPHHDLKKGSIFKTMKYLGFLPKEVPEGESKLRYYFKTGMNKALSGGGGNEGSK
ncbi:MAG TPA: hydrogenase [Bacteroidetes bacterium]|nr:hydrogenase [Bacteroidota bacterium]